MCGGEHSIRIERAGNGFVIDAYEPSSKGDRPGQHKKHVATNAEGVVHIVKKHLGRGKVKEAASKVKVGRKKLARKRG